MGAHSIGHVHVQNSGYGVQPDSSTNNLVNSWDPTPNVFDNEYYRGLLGVVSPLYPSIYLSIYLSISFLAELGE
jgi:hypothetical protein